jgi:hypothetical protein
MQAERDSSLDDKLERQMQDGMTEALRWSKAGKVELRG